MFCSQNKEMSEVLQNLTRGCLRHTGHISAIKCRGHRAHLSCNHTSSLTGDEHGTPQYPYFIDP